MMQAGRTAGTLRLVFAATLLSLLVLQQPAQASRLRGGSLVSWHSFSAEAAAPQQLLSSGGARRLQAAVGAAATTGAAAAAAAEAAAKVVGKYGSKPRAAEAPPVFAIKTVVLSVNLTGTKAFATNTMTMAPSTPTSCKPVPAAAAAAKQALKGGAGSGGRKSVALLKQAMLVNSSSSPKASAAPSPSVAMCSVPVELDAHNGLDILSVELNGKKLVAGTDYSHEGDSLTIEGVPAQPFTLRIRSSMTPPADPDVRSGFYNAGELYATHFEPVGISYLTPFPDDRPDIMSLWTVRLEGDQAALPVLLSNGRLVASGKLPGGRHFAEWKDPRPKPSYQVAIAAGKLAVKRDTFYSCLEPSRPVALSIYVPPNLADQVEFAMYSLKAAMAWHEAAWGVAYKSDAYTMVGVPFYNGEAAESSQMAAFDTFYLAATPETRTDADADAILRLVGHEFFHTYSGNYVTIRTYDDLTLKEGLTSYMEQSFAGDMATAEELALGVRKPLPGALTAPVNARCAAADAKAASTPAGAVPLQKLLPQLRAVASCQGGQGGCRTPELAAAAASEWHRIWQANYLRKNQMPEDESPSAHPIRVNSSEVWSPFTDTVYRKGAEVIGMYRELMGPARFGSGLSTFFKRYDGQAATIDQFLEVMMAAAGGSLPPNWGAWYDQPGTPSVSVAAAYDDAAKTLTLTLEQSNSVAAAKNPEAQPLPIPFKVGLLAASSGASLAPLSIAGGAPAGSRVLAANPGGSGSADATALLLLNSQKGTFTLTGVSQQPVVSALRGFSAPVQATVEGQTLEQLALLAKADPDMFARYNALYTLLYDKTLLALYGKAAAAKVKPGDQAALTKVLTARSSSKSDKAAADSVQGVPKALLDAYRAVLPQTLPGATKGIMLAMPSVSDLVSIWDESHADPLLMWQVRAHVGKVLAQQLKPLLLGVIKASDAAVARSPAWGFAAPAMAERLAANNALQLLAFNWDAEVEALVKQRYANAKTMSDRATALQLLVSFGSRAAAADAVAAFRARYEAKHPGVLLQLLQIRGASERPGSAALLRGVLADPRTIDSNWDQIVVKLLVEGYMASPVNYDAADGSGYKFMAEAILKVDAINPDAAAMLLESFAEFSDRPHPRRQAISAQIQALAAKKGQLSEALQGALETALGAGDAGLDDSEDDFTTA